jgi:hypothetical protein
MFSNRHNASSYERQCQLHTEALTTARVQAVRNQKMYYLYISDDMLWYLYLYIPVGHNLILPVHFYEISVSTRGKEQDPVSHYCPIWTFTIANFQWSDSDVPPNGQTISKDPQSV